MESKKFVNLSAEYKNFLSECSKIDKLGQIDDMYVPSGMQPSASGKTQFQVLTDLHNQVSKTLETKQLQISDINHLMINYTKPNTQVSQLKKLTHYRNYYIITNCLRTPQWKEFVSKIKTKIPNASIQEIEEVITKLLERYMGTWDTVEKIIVIDKKGLVKSIELVDPDDFEFIFNLLKK
jgi:preprotein translocase subunit Sss1